MEARAIARWGCRHAFGQPAIWCVALAFLALVPLSRALSPFPGLGLDPTWHLLQGWTPAAAWIGASLALLFLTRHQAFLELLPASSRRYAELQTLFLAPAALQGCLLLGALSTGLLGGSELVTWMLFSALINLHVAAVGQLALRAPDGGPQGGSVRIACLWALLWGFPALLKAGWVSALCAPVQGLGALQLPADLPRALLATLLSSLVFLLGAALVDSPQGRARLRLR